MNGPKRPNPLAQGLAFIAAAAMFVFAILIGGIVLTALLGFVLLAGVVIYARVWWLRRKFQRASPQGHAGPRRAEDIVEAEYQVIDIKDRDESAPR